MRSWKRVVVASLLGLLAGCGGEGPGPTFRTSPPEWPAGVSTKATASAGVLAGEVYQATDAALDSRTGLPFGYAPLAEGNAQVTIRQVGSRNSWQAAIASGSYRVAGLPLGVKLEVTANQFGRQPRTRSITLAPHGQGRLSFAYFGGSEDSYLLPQPQYRSE